MVITWKRVALGVDMRHSVILPRSSKPENTDAIAFGIFFQPKCHYYMMTLVN